MSAIRLIRNVLLVPALFVVAACSDFTGLVNEFSPDSKQEFKKIEPKAEAAPVQPVDVAPNQPMVLGHMKANEVVEAAPSESSNIRIIKPETNRLAADNQALNSNVVEQPSAVVSSAAVPNDPLLVVRFNQSHVYYDEAVTKAVRAVEAAKPTALYDLVSVLPNISSLPKDHQIKIISRSNNNMRSVALLMQQLGVPAQRIRVSNRQAPVNSQEILLFIQ